MAAVVGRAFRTSPVEAESTYVKRRTSQTQRSTKNEDREETEAASRGGAMAGGEPSTAAGVVGRFGLPRSKPKART